MLRKSLGLMLLVACGGSGAAPDAAPPLPDAAPEVDAPPVFPNPCADLGYPERAWSAGPYGARRGEIAEDFTVELLDGTEWSFAQRWSGCETYLFVPDTLANSDLDPTSVWARDIDTLVLVSPLNAHYFFVSRAANDADAMAATTAMQDRIDTTLARLGGSYQAHWSKRLHVVRPRAAVIGNWLGDAIATGHGRLGMAIDRLQRIRGIGFLADVWRYNDALNVAGYWPWESNLSYVANEAQYYNAQAVVQDRLDGETATVIDLWNDELLAEFAETDVMLPSAAEMAAFDTFEIEVVSKCPDVDALEFGNCGAWDYIASLAVRDETSMANVELARFITSYHRETRWVVDATAMLPLIQQGGMRHFRWDFAPSWNTQPTITRLSLRLSNRGKGVTPAEATFLYAGGAFNSTYNDVRAPIDVAIPADAQRVELVAIITGHGADTYSCAEFCSHQHEFTVNGQVHLKSFPEAQTNSGCALRIEDGMVPNQGGTWWFGRGGWCPGMQVDPWVVDVTSEVTPGTTATVSYRGLFGGVTPPDNAGNIVMVSYLVVYR